MDGFQVLKGRLAETKALVESLDTRKAVNFAKLVWNLKGSDKKIFFLGNGASHTIASHAALDYMSQTGIQTACASDVAILTAFSNDFGYDRALERFLKINFRKGDMLICISSSGNSANVVNAASFVKGKGGSVYAFTGFEKENKLNEIAGENSFWVDSRVYNVVESIHNLWLAMICDVLIEWMGDGVGKHGIDI